MADEYKPESREGGASPRSRVEPPATRAEARARLRGAMGGIAPDLASAAARAVAELRLGIAHRSGQIGFLDDVVDFIDDVADVTEEILNHVAMNTEEITEVLGDLTPDLTPVMVITIGIAAEPGGGGLVDIPDDTRGASARELLQARQAILEASALQSKGLKAIAQSLRAQLAAMHPPKP